MNTFLKNETKKSVQGMSVVVPFLNEAEGISAYCSAMDRYAGEVQFPIELVFVDDGSTDNTAEVIHAFQFHNISMAKLVTLSKNFGSHAAIRAGVLHSTYDICTWMGSDLQEPIEFLQMSYEKMLQGYDTVYIEKNSIRVSKVNRGF